MTDSELDPYVEWIARERIMAAVRAEPLPRRSFVWRAGDALHRFVEPRAITLSPAWSTLLAAGLVGIGIFAGVATTNRDGRPSAGQPRAVAAPQLPVSDTFVKFTVAAPAAHQVFLVGDFNDWDLSKTPMAQADHGGVWSVVVPLPAGRHLYSFVVDGKRWISDPNAPFAPDDGFGHTNSVKIVGRGSTS